MKKCVCVMLLSGAALTLSGCLAEVGSERWCNNMKEKPKSDWTASEAVDFAKHCIIK
ncbi:MAG: DUF3012 domain-containing protein [Candidatus Electrothrix sp. AR4]|nr:DUF3012 domain-containing protein [Candidatus Electrothrix sp. AR4]